MTDVLWETAGPPVASAGAPETLDLSPAVRRVIAAVRAGTAGGMFPPVARRHPEGVLAIDRHLAGDADARLLTCAFGEARFAPLLGLLDHIDTWCRTAAGRFAAVIAPDVLSVTNAELFGPVVSEAFTACAAARGTDVVPARWAWFAAFLDLFGDRLESDLRRSWFEEPEFAPPVTALWAHDAETHNGGARVLRLRMEGGGRVAYKPRPTGGEALFLAESRTGGQGFPEGPPASVFALLNELPPASGEIRLPVLRCRSDADGDADGDRTHSWQEWIEPPAQWGTTRRSEDGGLCLEGTLLDPAEAPRFWHRAGSLTAACFGFGIGDLGEGNILAGARATDDEPLLYPVDLEVFFAPVERLYDTGLVPDTLHGGTHHAGLENVARWCGVDGPAACFLPAPGGGLRLVLPREPFARERARSVVADRLGNTGYGRYLPAFLRGMFDAWTLMCVHRDRVRHLLADASAGRFVRVLTRPTAVYAEALNSWSPAGGNADGTVFGPRELEQLARLDVPYFFRAAHGGPLLVVEPPSSVHEAESTIGELWPPAAAVRRGENLDLAGLGVALRDAVEHVFGDVVEHTVTDSRYGVRLHLSGPDTGEVGFDWPQAGRRVTYAWDRAKVRLRLDPLETPATPSGAAEEIRRRLLRLDRVDAALRSRWADDGFTDTALDERLAALTGTAMTWLRDVVARYGWPGETLVGRSAAAAACRLVQHADGPRDFQDHCLALIRRAATAGDVPWRQVAYVTDALCVRDDRPQLFGTKFRAVEGRLVPFPIERPEQVDERRRRMGMEPLNRYAARLRRRFPLTDGAGTQEGRAS
ncbi:DUF6624 domain-containing protein [Actinoallomurus sp. NPDC050550]|uniref:DUF6624 domain-containing protein n=1 Tax=Actinoallomurus sp. NPDC050550 TaxID=3154937 RepID=UPI0033C0CFF8